MSKRPSRKSILIFVGAILTLLIIGFAVWLIQLDRGIRQRLNGKRFLPPIEYYAAPLKIRRGQEIDPATLTHYLSTHGFRSRAAEQALHPGDFTLFDGIQCQERISEALSDKVSSCLLILGHQLADLPYRTQDQLLVFDVEQTVMEIYAGQPLVAVSSSELEPELFAQFYGDQPILRKIIDLGQAPIQCLNAIVAIEDNQFLQHSGVSLKGLMRAVVRNLQAGRLVEGGSTLTQQLVKNYFLTSDRTFRRKFKELFMAILLELRWSKDEILETYINLIYMGQNGPFQIRGLASASEYYFAQSIEELNLSQCSLLAALVNSPGLFNPFNHPEAARQRRQKVLEHMYAQQMINEGEKLTAMSAPLPTRPSRELSEPAPYFVAAINKRIKELGIDDSEGLRIYSTLNMAAQESAQQAVSQNLQRIEKDYPLIRKIKEEKQNIEGMFLSADVASGEILSLVGGRNFRQSQYNRATESHRQVGSLMKPFVFLTALESQTTQGEPYTPISLIEDKPFTYKYGKQKWAPKNYGNKYYGRIPLFFALKNSLNCATAKLGISIGLDAIIDVARRAGIQSTIDPLPSLTLGAYELYPMEVLQAYSTLAAIGRYRPITLIRAVTSLDGKVIFKSQALDEQRFAPGTAAELVGMMKQTLNDGTAANIRSIYHFDFPAAGKTGTTSDTKDAWFAGFTPHHVAIAWVGYDDNTPHGLTGSSGAAPIWSQYMNSYYKAIYPKDDFLWPPGTVDTTLDPDELSKLGVPSDEKHPLSSIQLIFLRGQEP